MIDKSTFFIICTVVWVALWFVLYKLKLRVIEAKINRNISEIMIITLLRAYVKTTLENNRKLTVQDHADQIVYMGGSNRIEAEVRSYCLERSKNQYSQHIIEQINKKGWINGISDY